jgi:hypothetical protein
MLYEQAMPQSIEPIRGIATYTNGNLIAMEWLLDGSTSITAHYAGSAAFAASNSPAVSIPP